VIFGTKSGVQPCNGCGRNAGWLSAGVPSALRFCTWSLARICALSGSQTMIFTSGRSFRSTRATPSSVPPVPAPVTQ